MVQLLIDKARELPISEADHLRAIAAWLGRLNEVTLAAEMEQLRQQYAHLPESVRTSMGIGGGQ